MFINQSLGIWDIYDPIGDQPASALQGPDPPAFAPEKSGAQHDIKKAHQQPKKEENTQEIYGDFVGFKMIQLDSSVKKNIKCHSENAQNFFNQGSDFFNPGGWETTNIPISSFAGDIV